MSFWKILLNIYYWPVFIIFTVVGLLILPFILFVNVAFLSRKIDSALRRAIRVYGWFLVRLFPFFGPVTVEYKTKNLPTPAIFVANHNSAIDPYLFGAIPVENSFVTSWPFKIPVYNIFMRLAGYVNVEEGWEKLQKRVLKLLEGGSSITIWPEGHRSRNGLLGRFKKGAFSLAVESGIPLIPVCILGSATVMPPGHRLLNPGRIKLIVLEPVFPKSGSDKQELASCLRKRVRQIIEKNLEENNHFRFCAPQQ